MNCPDCGLDELESLGIEKGERVDDEHCLLITQFKCRNCGCIFSEIQHTQWNSEVTKHGNLASMLKAEVATRARKKFEAELSNLEQALRTIIEECKDDRELLAVFEFKLREHIFALKYLREAQK